ncbi:MAG: hypothetical protein HKN80_00275 [Acidimicrobiia bacterium]|nr:hypothetical protein [Acidimicrobiia bacterium]
MVHQVFNDAFEALLAGWHRHMDLAASTDNILKLAESRLEIDALRARAFQVRRSAPPADRELDHGHLSAYCPFLRTTVYVPTNELQYTRDDVLTFECECERKVAHRPKEWHRDTEEPAFTAPGYLADATRPTRVRPITTP